MNDVAFVSCAFGDRRYVDQQMNLLKSVHDFYPDNQKYFWTDEFPPNTRPFNESMYGFKVHAIEHAIKQGHKKILFFDPACYLVDKVDYYFDLIPDYGVIAAQDDNLLANYCGDEAFAFWNISREQSREQAQHLVGGSLYVFDLDLPLSGKIFRQWFLSEKAGIFGNSETQGHRYDESNMALSLYMNGSKPVPYDICRYNDVPNPIVKKKHFK